MIVINSQQIRPLENLRVIRDELIKNGWSVDAFPFQYKQQKFVVLIKVLSDREKKKNKYAVVNLEFIKLGNGNDSYCSFADTTKLHITDLSSFRNYFGIEYKDNIGDITEQFAEYLSTSIPNHLSRGNDELLQSTIIGHLSKSEPGNYCFDFKRTGKRKDDTPKQRSFENNQKAALLRPNLYAKLKEYTEFSFCFSVDPNKCESDDAIYNKWATRNNN